MATKLVTKNLCKTFVMKSRDSKVHALSEVCALKDVNIEIKENEFVSMIGPTGCGKTTLLRIVDGLIPRDSGEIFLDNTPIEGTCLDIGIVFQTFNLLPWRTVLGNTELGLEARGIPHEERKKIARKYLDMLGLHGFENHYPHEISGGMQQRVGIARALAIDPKVLLMDEPFGSVDAWTREVLQDELLKIWTKHKKTVLFVTHSIDEAIYLSDKILIMSCRPAHVKEIVDVDLSRPRSSYSVRSDPRFIDLSLMLREKLEREAVHAAEEMTAPV